MKNDVVNCSKRRDIDCAWKLDKLYLLWLGWIVLTAGRTVGCDNGFEIVPLPALLLTIAVVSSHGCSGCYLLCL